MSLNIKNHKSEVNMSKDIMYNLYYEISDAPLFISVIIVGSVIDMNSHLIAPIGCSRFFQRIWLARVMVIAGEIFTPRAEVHYFSSSHISLSGYSPTKALFCLCSRVPRWRGQHLSAFRMFGPARANASTTTG